MSGLDGIVLNIYINGDAAQRGAISSALSSSVTKSEANYRPSEPESDEDQSTVPEECGTCSMYSSDGGGMGACDLVAGSINPEYVCDNYEQGTQ